MLRERLREGVPAETAIKAPKQRGHPALPRARRPAVPKRVYSSPDWPRAVKLRKSGMSVRDVAAELGVAPVQDLPVFTGKPQVLGP